jgi:uncharacterized protein (DUF58 family)
MSTRDPEDKPLVNLADLAEIELLIVRRMREVSMGEHRSVRCGSGFDFVGLRDWQAGDRMSNIDWPQSSLTNFSPMVVRELEQPSTATVVAVADTSLSTRCGTGSVPVAALIARAIGTIGISAVFFQDMFGLMTFDGAFEQMAGIRPRVGRNQVMHCIDAYQFRQGLQPITRTGSLDMTLAHALRRTSMVPVISDFLFGGAHAVLRDLALLNSSHDVFVVLIDSAFAFDVPVRSAGWIEVFDVETGRSRVVSGRKLRELAARAQGWQEGVARTAKAAGLDVLRLGADGHASAVAIIEFIAERRLRKAA